MQKKMIFFQEFIPSSCSFFKKRKVLVYSRKPTQLISRFSRLALHAYNNYSTPPFGFHLFVSSTKAEKETL